MRTIIIILIELLLLIFLVNAHSIETKEIIKSDGEYNIKFSRDPEFPVINKKVHLDFEVWDNNGKEFHDLNFKVKIDNNLIELNKKHSHYELEYGFKTPGNYKIIPYINDEKLDINFELDVDSFDSSGWFKVLIIFLFAMLIVIKILLDCKKGKSRRLKTRRYKK